MFGWIFGKKEVKNKVDHVENNMKKSFSEVKSDFEAVTKWIKHLDNKDKQLFDLLNDLKNELSSVKDEVDGVKEAVALMNLSQENKQLLKKRPVLNKQVAVYAVEEPVQTAVQTGNFHDILQNLSSNERLLVLTLLNSEMKLSYEDLARLLGKERSTIRGQINAIKQKSEGLLHELVEPNGKKRVFIDEEVRVKLEKYAKVRVKKKGKYRKLPQEAEL